MIQNIGELKTYDQGGQESIQSQLSQIAFKYINDKDKPKALITIYHFLCDFKNPIGADLTNLLFLHNINGASI